MKTQIVELLTDQSDLFLTEIATRLGASDDEVRPHLRALVGDGVVKMKEDTVEHAWMYRLSDAWAYGQEVPD